MFDLAHSITVLNSPEL